MASTSEIRRTQRKISSSSSGGSDSRKHFWNRDLAGKPVQIGAEKLTWASEVTSEGCTTASVLFDMAVAEKPAESDISHFLAPTENLNARILQWRTPLAM